MHARSLIRIINCHALKQIAQHGNKLKRIQNGWKIRTDLERIRNGSKTDNEILLNGNGTTRSVPFRFIKRQREVFCRIPYGMGHKKVPVFCKSTTVQQKFCVPFRCTYFRVYFCCVGKIILRTCNGEKL